MANRTDVIIIGSGVAALQMAKELSRDMNVIIFTKSKATDSNSYMAQGGIAAALGSKDSPSLHLKDTLEAGRWHNDEKAARRMTEAAPGLINELLASGCSFDRSTAGELLLGMEGAHREKRIVHGGGDATGKKLIAFLLAQTTEKTLIIEDFFVYDLLTNDSGCYGVRGIGQDGKQADFYANHIVLATGGCGQLYSYTSNAAAVTGDGIALAYRAGAEVADMEFIQFHPTLLSIGGKGAGLISEAVRGEGARLVTADGRAIMENVHPMKDLAPRHIVSQTIFEYINSGTDIFLDITSIGNFASRFPTITEMCRENGISLKRGLLPVIPGSHFLMGGIRTDLEGRTSVSGLYAIGEAACTGVHGANRLASNSLLEGLYFGRQLARYILSCRVQRNEAGSRSIETDESRPLPYLPDIEEIKEHMMMNAGIVRTASGLLAQREWLQGFGAEKWVSASLEGYRREDMKVIFMLIASWLITEAALKRTESRGGHFRSDFPFEDDQKWLRVQIIQQKDQKEEDGENEQIKAAAAT
ncbi:L-aspartate oxidase [Bacillus infantis]|uniref:L-aspartate oxidase n=1 Tax=Bacillus infantis TaxID=324767 RepID=A0A5D4RP81_9BACI|nr:L-aspartate oxidase [Bacillus infantis]TYS51302.1 L-aspartate oxidase [Bacillus infantis]